MSKAILIQSQAQKPLAADLHWPPKGQAKALLIFAHGFKGFKDWGHWAALGEAFAEAGYAFLRFNYRYNGIVPPAWKDLQDLEAFGQNNFSRELADWQDLLDYCAQQPELAALPWVGIGHSRSGPIVLLQALRDSRLQACMTWAAVSHLDYAWRNQPAEAIEAWRQAGTREVLNARTGQALPLYFQLYEDFAAHTQAYSLEGQLQALKAPCLLVHGEADPAVPVEALWQLKAWLPQAQTLLIPGTDHVFGGREPFEGELSTEARALLVGCLDFLGQNLEPEI